MNATRRALKLALKSLNYFADCPDVNHKDWAISEGSAAIVAIKEVLRNLSDDGEPKDE
jgi:hypothetical protein